MVTSISPPSLQFPTKTLVPLPPSPTTGADHSMTANTLPVVAIVLGVTLPIIGVTLVITGIIITLVSRVQSRKQAASNDASRNEDVNANTPFCPQGDHEHTRYDGGGTIILQYNYNGSGYQSEDNVIVTEAPGVVPMELPPPQFDTRSTIDEMELSNYINSNDFQC